MIASIEGKLTRLDSNSCLIQVGSIGYEIMLPGYCIDVLSQQIGSDVTLRTMEYYEGTPGGGNLIPRMIGFLNSAERDFFTKFISVKGIGIKKGLRALSIPVSTIASAIENGDEKILTTLPSIGKRMSQLIIAQLKGKLEAFAADAQLSRTAATRLKPFQAEALEILIVWGEKRNDAIELIELAANRHPEIDSCEQLVPLVYRLKQGIEV